MLRASKTWDIRCSPDLRALLGDKSVFPWWNAEKKGRWWYKVNLEGAKKICGVLAAAYGVSVPRIKVGVKGKYNGQYSFGSRTIYMWPRNHIKTIFHEFYHHLDNMTKGKYNSDDRGGGPKSLAWQFGDHMYHAMFHG